MYNEVDFLSRFAQAAGHGFRGVEFLFPYDHVSDDIAQALHAAGLKNILFNLPPGDWEAGERGLAGLPGREADFHDALDEALHYALALGCHRLHAMYGIPGPELDPRECRRVYIDNLRFAAQKAALHGIAILIEPLSLRDVPGYPLNYQRDARDIILAVGEPNVHLQFDMYHCQIVEGDVAMTFRELKQHVGHIQIAGVPERN